MQDFLNDIRSDFGNDSQCTAARRAYGNINIKHTFESLSPCGWGDKFFLACIFIRYFVTPFALNFLHGCLVMLGHNEFSEFRIRREYILIPYEFVPGSGHQSSKFA
jgi:hypothetical protein